MKILACSLCAALITWSLMVLPAGAGSFEQDLLLQINNYRETKGLKPLSGSNELDKLAREHSLAMKKADNLSHDGFKERFKKAKARACVENVGWNHQDPTSQFQGWKDSPGHDKNMLNPDLSKAGINKTGPYVTFFACK